LCFPFAFDRPKVPCNLITWHVVEKAPTKDHCVSAAGDEECDGKDCTIWLRYRCEFVGFKQISVPIAVVLIPPLPPVALPPTNVKITVPDFDWIPMGNPFGDSCIPYKPGDAVCRELESEFA
jgi:hypothetical protein